MEPSTRPERISALLVRELAAEHVAVIDNSALHDGHLEAAGGGGHFRVLVVSERFRGLLPLAAHRLVYGALAPLMSSEIHALELETLTPDQWRQRQG